MATELIFKGIILIWLGICAWQDAKHGEVSNWLTIPPLVVAAVYAVVQGEQLFVLFAAAFAGLTLLFFLNAIGGADVKILASLAGLWPTAFWGAMIAQGIWGVIALLRKGRKAEFRAVPAFAVGAVVSWLINI